MNVAVNINGHEVHRVPVSNLGEAVDVSAALFEEYKIRNLKDAGLKADVAIEGVISVMEADDVKSDNYSLGELLERETFPRGSTD